MKFKGILLPLIAVLTVFAFLGCSNAAGPSGSGVDTTAPTVVSTIPADGAMDVINSAISAKFSEAMDPETIEFASFTVFDDAEPAVAVDGTVSYDATTMTARFAPTSVLADDTQYTATLTTSMADIGGNTMNQSYVWTFTTEEVGVGPATVLLGSADNFVILAKTAISTVPSSVITGNIGISPAAESYITGFALTDATGYATSTQVTGFVYAADMAPPTSTMMTTAISDMETAYSDAHDRIDPDYLNIGAGEIGGMTLTAGLYNWTSSVSISSNLTLSGGANDVWIFQTSGDLNLSNTVQIFLSGDAQAKNIFWQVAGATSLGTDSKFQGVILCKTAITVNTGASIVGKLLAQSAVALDQATVTDVQ